MPELDRTLAGLSLLGAPALAVVMEGGAPPAAGGAAVLAWLGYALAVRSRLVQAGLGHLGAANRVTLLRGLLVSLVIPFAAAAPAWLPVALGALALALDGVDGGLARRRQSESAFGARLDMETDAWTVLVLSAVVAAQGRVAPWVLLSGAARYLYVVAGCLWPALRRPPPPSFARKLVCVLQVAGLLAALAPTLPPPWPSAVAGTALLLLAWSFGRDIRWLLRGKGMAESLVAPYLNESGGV